MSTMSTKTISFIAAGIIFVVLIILLVVGNAVLGDNGEDMMPQPQQILPSIEQDLPLDQGHALAPEPVPVPEVQAPTKVEGQTRVDFEDELDNIQTAVVTGKRLLMDDETHFVQAFIDVQFGSQTVTVPVATYLYYAVSNGSRVDLNLRYSGNAWTVFGIRESQ